jgi:hypothetical protein
MARLLSHIRKNGRRDPDETGEYPPGRGSPPTQRSGWDSSSGTVPSFWLNLQTHRDLKQAHRNLKPEDAERIKAQRVA